ncbi:nudix hydrolase homolog 24 [Striga asiatica]|uniref:Nudix hydrolase homolog 24 n=1 Tax=Striga asiatica TaxID=4170 RepID=A0A5A7PWY9_STRAF|nr:nudix hydrolase homolog 24 [Striga asiatica]
MALSCCSAFRSRPITPLSFPSPRRNPSPRRRTLHLHSHPPPPITSPSLHDGFTWDDVVRLPPTPPDLRGFFEKVAICNRDYGKLKSEFIPFAVDGHVVGHIHREFAGKYLRPHKDVFTFPEKERLELHPDLATLDRRTEAIGHVINRLCEEEEDLIPGIRNEMYPVKSSFGSPETFFLLERAAAPYFGIKAYGVHMNGYVEGVNKDMKKHLWIGKRSRSKSTYPGRLDHLVAGGLPDGLSCDENIVKECEEEAGIPRSISSRAKPVGAVSYVDIDGYRLKRDVLFCYDLKVPEGFVPVNEDGEVESFRMVEVERVADIVRTTDFFKDNCNLVIIDFLFRHGYIRPEEPGYLDLLRSLRNGDCT